MPVILDRAAMGMEPMGIMDAIGIGMRQQQMAEQRRQFEMARTDEMIQRALDNWRMDRDFQAQQQQMARQEQMAVQQQEYQAQQDTIANQRADQALQIQQEHARLRAKEIDTRQSELEADRAERSQKRTDDEARRHGEEIAFFSSFQELMSSGALDSQRGSVLYNQFMGGDDVARRAAWGELNDIASQFQQGQAKELNLQNGIDAIQQYAASQGLRELDAEGLKARLASFAAGDKTVEDIIEWIDQQTNPQTWRDFSVAGIKTSVPVEARPPQPGTLIDLIPESGKRWWFNFVEENNLVPDPAPVLHKTPDGKGVWVNAAEDESYLPLQIQELDQRIRETLHLEDNEQELKSLRATRRDMVWALKEARAIMGHYRQAVEDAAIRYALETFPWSTLEDVSERIEAGMSSNPALRNL